MRELRFKRHQVGSPGTWLRGTVVDLVKEMPHLWWAREKGQLPKYEELNALFLTGKDDAGMSGGAEWKPFTLTPEEYEEIWLELATEPGSKIILP